MMTPIACGGCGNETFSIFFRGKPETELLVECCKCKSATIVKPAAPRLFIGWTEDAKPGFLEAIVDERPAK